VANKLRLLKLSPECAGLLLEHGLTERHARALLRVEGEGARRDALQHIIDRGLNVAQTEAYIEQLLQQKSPKVAPKKPSYIIKDVRLFLNSIDHSVDVIRRAGVNAHCGREETEDTITLTICIPKHKG
jgi:ParB family chromosome partitioning protein